MEEPITLLCWFHPEGRQIIRLAAINILEATPQHFTVRFHMHIYIPVTMELNTLKEQNPKIWKIRNMLCEIPAEIDGECIVLKYCSLVKIKSHVFSIKNKVWDVIQNGISVLLKDSNASQKGMFTLCTYPPLTRNIC